MKFALKCLADVFVFVDGLLLSSLSSTLQMFGYDWAHLTAFSFAAIRSSRQHCSSRAGHRRRCGIDRGDVPPSHLVSSYSLFTHISSCVLHCPTP